MLLIDKFAAFVYGIFLILATLELVSLLSTLEDNLHHYLTAPGDKVLSSEILGCPTYSTSLKSTLFAADVPQLSILVAGLQESGIEDAVLHGNLENKYVIRDYIWMIKTVCRMVEPALEQYNRKTIPYVEDALASSKDTISYVQSLQPSPLHWTSRACILCLFQSDQNHMAFDSVVDEAVSSTLDLYITLQHNSGPHGDAVHGILNTLEEYLNDLVTILSFSQNPQTQFTIHDAWKWLLNHIFGTENHTDDEALQGRVSEAVKQLRGSIINLRSRLDYIQAGFEDLGDQTLYFLLSSMGRPISAEGFMQTFSTLACGASRLRAELEAA